MVCCRDRRLYKMVAEEQPIKRGSIGEKMLNSAENRCAISARGTVPCAEKEIVKQEGRGAPGPRRSNENRGACFLDGGDCLRQFRKFELETATLYTHTIHVL